MAAKTPNRCYGSRYGDRYGRNFAAPRKKTGETWAAYHDRLAAMALEARRRGASSAALVLERRAGDVASKHKLVRTKARRSSKGPGTYPWAQCIKDARARGARDPAAVCGAIRAQSRKTYPAYWKARHKKRNPSADQAKTDARDYMGAAVDNVSNGLRATTGKVRMDWFVSSILFAGEAAAYARISKDVKLQKAVADTTGQLRRLIVEQAEWRSRNRAPKPKAKKVTKNRSVAAAKQKREFLRGLR